MSSKPQRKRPPRKAAVSPSGAASYVGGKRAALEAVRAGRAELVFVAQGARSTEGLQDLMSAAERAGVRIDRVEPDRLDELARDHRGVVAKVSVPSELGERDLASFPFSDEAVVVVLDGIEDPQNLGAAARVADGAGAAMLVTRVRRAAAVTPSAVRTSAGALITLPHARVANITRAIERLKDNGFTVVGLDDAARVGIFDEPCPAGRIAVVVGAEGTGMGRLVREACDLTVSLPMRGQVASLNAATALAAFLYAYVLAARTQG